MDLPFAVDSPDRGNSLHRSNSDSLVSASSQGSLLPAESADNGGFYSNEHLPIYENVYTRNHSLNPHVLSPPIAPPHMELKLVDRPMSEAEFVDFTYVNVCETDADEVDVVMDGRNPAAPERDTTFSRGDVLAALLSGDSQQNGNPTIVIQCEGANEAAHRASEAKHQGDLATALNAHSEAAKRFREAAVAVREADGSLSDSLLLLSQAQAKSALALKRILKRHPEGVTTRNKSAGAGQVAVASSLSQKERLRATVRGALFTRNEADISDSTFLGRATSGPHHSPSPIEHNAVATFKSPSELDHHSNGLHNPVDEMMELERELRDMDMALEMGNSILSLGARTQNRLKHSTMEDGSFCVVPPGSSYMSSQLWASGIANNPRPSVPHPVVGTAGVRARANRVQNILDASASTTPAVRSHVPQPATVISQHPTQRNPLAPGLESSWWGNASTASQVLASSIVSSGGTRIGQQHLQQQQHVGDVHQGQQPTNTKQLMRLLDSIKTLGDENATLLREVEDAEAARAEAKATREQMRRFKAEYGKRFEALKSALEKFRKGYPENHGGERNPVTSSDFVQSASTSEQLQRQEQLIRKLTVDLKKEKEESKKKDAALRKYESFYREVKARSAQKAAQRQMEAQQLPRSKITTTSRVPR